MHSPNLKEGFCIPSNIPHGALFPNALAWGVCVGPCSEGREAGSAAVDLLTGVARVELVLQVALVVVAQLVVPQVGAGVDIVGDENGVEQDGQDLEGDAQQGQLEPEAGGAAGHAGTQKEAKVKARAGGG